MLSCLFKCASTNPDVIISFCIFGNKFPDRCDVKYFLDLLSPKPKKKPQRLEWRNLTFEVRENPNLTLPFASHADKIPRHVVLYVQKGEASCFRYLTDNLFHSRDIENALMADIGYHLGDENILRKRHLVLYLPESKKQPFPLDDILSHCLPEELDVLEMKVMPKK